MRRALLDINVLLALFDRDHVDHERAHEWLGETPGRLWATCPITENGLVRVISQPRYPSAVAPAVAVELLGEACEVTTHEFWPCDVSLLDSAQVDPNGLLGAAQVTDVYLLTLAFEHGGQFVTFDRSVAVSAACRAESEHLVVL